MKGWWWWLGRGGGGEVLVVVRVVVCFTLNQPSTQCFISPFIHHPSTIHHHPSTIHHHPSTIHHHPSTIHHHPSTIHHHPSTIHHPSIHHHPPPIHQPPFIHHQSTTIHPPPSIHHHHPPPSTTIHPPSIHHPLFMSHHQSTTHHSSCNKYPGLRDVALSCYQCGPCGEGSIGTLAECPTGTVNCVTARGYNPSGRYFGAAILVLADCQTFWTYKFQTQLFLAQVFLQTYSIFFFAVSLSSPFHRSAGNIEGVLQRQRGSGVGGQTLQKYNEGDIQRSYLRQRHSLLLCLGRVGVRFF